ncbi:MAG: potassium channel protein [Chitinophagaceae bacterium]|nr:MAG: potassium channel protein [Chitinophagaceae bacterium]
MKVFLQRLLIPLLFLHIIILAGIAGYMILENYTLLEAVYMTTLAITTVGFHEVRPLGPQGQLFTIILLVVSWVALAFIIARITQFVISGELNQYFKTRKLMSAIDKLKNHVIICGFGRNGQQAARTLQVHHVPFVVIEKNPKTLDDYVAEHPEVLFMLGDGTDDDNLRKAGIEKAKALITALPADADNVFIVLSARTLNPGIRIISRASDSATMPKLKKAGADNVILPDKIGGTHMATLVSKPDVIEFIDYLSGEEGESINVESVPYEELPDHIREKTLHDVMDWKKTGVNCIGIKNLEGKFVINPPEDTIITKGMKVIVLGTKMQIERMKGNLESL